MFGGRSTPSGDALDSGLAQVRAVLVQAVPSRHRLPLKQAVGAFSACGPNGAGPPNAGDDMIAVSAVTAGQAQALKERPITQL